MQALRGSQRMRRVWVAKENLRARSITELRVRGDCIAASPKMAHTAFGRNEHLQTGFQMHPSRTTPYARLGSSTRDKLVPICNPPLQSLFAHERSFIHSALMHRTNSLPRSLKAATLRFLQPIPGQSLSVAPEIAWTTKRIATPSGRKETVIARKQSSSGQLQTEDGTLLLVNRTR